MLESGPAPTGTRRLRLTVNPATAVPAAAIGALIALLAAEVLPWASVGISGNGSLFDTDNGSSIAALRNGLDLRVLDLPPGILIPLQLGWMLVLAALATMLFGPGRLRRPFAAAAAGLAAGVVAVMVGVIGESTASAGTIRLYSGSGLSLYGTDLQGKQAPGMFCGALAAVLALAAAALALRVVPVAVASPPAAVPAAPNGTHPEPAVPMPAEAPFAWRRPAVRPAAWEGEEPDDGPLDLTVTALPPGEYLRRSP